MIMVADLMVVLGVAATMAQGEDNNIIDILIIITASLPVVMATMELIPITIHITAPALLCARGSEHGDVSRHV